MNLWQRFFGAKDSQARIALSFRQVGNPVMTPRNYEGFSKEGYQKNVMVFACIQKIATACAGIEWELYQKARGKSKGTEIEEHDLLTLIQKPNPLQGQASFFENFVAYYMLTGNTYIEAVRPRPSLAPMELWVDRPDKMSIVPNAKGYPGKYIFKVNDIEKTWLVNPVSLQCDIMHMKTFHPLNDWYGMSPLEAALFALDQSNQGQKWNLGLLQNSATPSGVLQMRATDVNPGGNLTEEQFARLKAEVDENMVGAKNSGRPLILEGGMEWKSMSLSPKDMEFLQNKNVTAIDICTVFGVPPEMLGLGQKTYQNYQEARQAFYEDTICPLMDKIKHDLNNWLVPMFGDGLHLCYDKDDIEALAPKREKKFTMIKDANFLTQNEKREASGYDPLEGWDVFVIGSQILETPDSTGDQTEGDQNDETSDVEQVQQPGSGQLQGGKKPVQEGNQSEDPSGDGEKGFGWKSINNLNRNEKLSSWKNQNRRRSKLEASFKKDLQSDFKEMYSDMTKAIGDKTDARLVEYALLKVMDEHMGVIKKTLSRHIKYTLNDFGSMMFNEAKSVFPDIPETKGTRQYEDWAQRYISKRSGDAIGQIEGTTKNQVKRVVKDITQRAVVGGESTHDIVKELTDEFETLGKSRAQLIARTEVASASNNATIQAVRSLELPNMVKEWVSSEDDRVRDGGKDGHGPDHESMNGQSVPLDEKFSVPPDADMDGPGDPAGGAGQICNCRCVLTFTSKNGPRGGE